MSTRSTVYCGRRLHLFWDICPEGRRLFLAWEQDTPYVYSWIVRVPFVIRP